MGHPLLDQAGWVILSHTVAAAVALLLGALQLLRRKGDGAHRTMGWMWVAAMTYVAASSFWIHEIDLFMGFSPIHLLSILVLITLPLAVMHAKRGRITAHGRAMTLLFAGGLVVAGAFTLLPNRLLGQLVFGAEIDGGAP